MFEDGLGDSFGYGVWELESARLENTYRRMQDLPLEEVREIEERTKPPEHIGELLLAALLHPEIFIEHAAAQRILEERK